MNASVRAAPEVQAAARPLSAIEFADRIGRLGPFEAAPRLAVAVSGGPDSLALALLAAGWAAARGGTVAGVTVDHRLRPSSGAEAATVGGWLRGRGIPHVTLTWAGARPESGVQAAARQARYALLEDWCRREEILHLLLAHHRDDQEETIAHRMARGSGPDGRAGMAAVREVEGLRLLRPLLDVAKARLVGTLEAAGQPWLEDPSNRSDCFARARLRAGPPLAGMLAEGRVRARERRSAEEEAAVWLARHARVDPLGFVLIERAPLLAASAEIRRRVLRAAVMTSSGSSYPPPGDGLAALADALARGATAGRTLGGARILVRGDRVLVTREAGAICARPQPLAPGLLFDGRFRFEAAPAAADIVVAPLGARGWQMRRQLNRVGPCRPVPQAVGEGLPALFGTGKVVAVPLLGLLDPSLGHLGAVRVAFRPRHPLAGAPFADPWAMASFASDMR